MSAKKFPEERRILITQMKRFDYGKEMIARALTPISFVIAVFTLLKVYNISFTLMQIAAVSAVGIFVMFLIGFVWDKLGMIEEEIEYGNERNRFVKVLLKKTWLKKLKKSKIVDD